MSSTSRVWTVAASIGVVEAMNHQGICRWNHSLKSIQQYAKTHLRSYSQAKRIPAHYSSAVSNKIKAEKLKKSEESLRTVMYLSCWGPN
ncbi:uncharacterized protein LOC107430248 [Ziziphus jujuba]|uniref:Uncharacterized protein LOC107430248 n=1 Tax=Ziziphus jujuba TaxID=326968 RepID=A0A6P4B3G3_ZIZJJ|nr:uncharacterized protein LOC107430248 [Ziziphus jujuba]